MMDLLVIVARMGKDCIDRRMLIGCAVMNAEETRQDEPEYQPR